MYTVCCGYIHTHWVNVHCSVPDFSIGSDLDRLRLRPDGIECRHKAMAQQALGEIETQYLKKIIFYYFFFEWWVFGCSAIRNPYLTQAIIFSIVKIYLNHY